ncbi:glycosyltransferase [Microbacterium sp. YY-01]|uniref:glycosyltransferase n=1 Tax=Microbacterium sp. YY-01 TaxID=3421634 RepID=UPI003D17DB7C
MVVLLRVVLDQLVAPSNPDFAVASRGLAEGLIRVAPQGCGVEAILPAGEGGELEGAATTRRLRWGRRELVAAWPMGVPSGMGSGMFHSPTLLSPMMRHDRAHDATQTVATLWNLEAWEAPERLPRAHVGWQRAMLRRVARHADAVVVPSHAIAERLAELAPVRERTRVIAGAAPIGFSVPDDAEERRRELSLPEEYVVVVGDETTLYAGFVAAAAVDLPAVVVDAKEGQEPAWAAIAAEAGLAENRAHIRLWLDDDDRAAVLHGASVVIGTSPRSAWPWRIIEAMTLGVPVVAVDSGVHRDVVADGGEVVAEADLADAVRGVVGETTERAQVLAADRARAFSWLSSAERVWALHADL